MTPADLLNPRNARVLIVLALAASGVLLIAWQSHLTFLVDDWDLLLFRRGFNSHALLDPHSRHLIVGPVLVYKAIQATFGMDSNTPYGVAATLTFLASVALLYVYVRRRVGDWVALAAVLPILVMGSAYEDLLTAFQIGYFGSVAFGIAALLAIERADRRGDAFACVLLVLSLAFAEIALAFAAGVAVAIALQRGPLRRAWVVAVPIVLYLIWYPTFGQSGPHIGPSSFSLHNVATSPPYVLDGFASSAGSLLGLGTPLLFGGSGGLEWGRPLLLALGVISVAWVLRGRPAQRWWILVPLVAGGAFWFLTAANFNFGRSPAASRYQYVGAVFLVMIAAQVAAGWRPAWRGVVAVLVVGIVAALGNLSMLHQGYRALNDLSVVVRGGLTGLDITADRVRPDLELNPENSDVNFFTLLEAGPYLSAAEKFGSPAYSQEELATAPETARVAADKVMAAALPVALRPGPANGRGCTSVTGIGAGAPIVSLPPGGASLSAPSGAGASLALRRYAGDSFPVNPGPLRGQARLVVPTDRSSRPWQLKVDSPGPVSVCPL
jgi:hypothetical protein